MTWLQLQLNRSDKLALVNADHIASVTPYPYDRDESPQACITFTGQGDEDGLIVSHTVAELGEMLGAK